MRGFELFIKPVESCSQIRRHVFGHILAGSEKAQPYNGKISSPFVVNADTVCEWATPCADFPPHRFVT